MKKLFPQAVGVSTIKANGPLEPFAVQRYKMNSKNATDMPKNIYKKRLDIGRIKALFDMVLTD